jgi:hypothetical protein
MGDATQSATMSFSSSIKRPRRPIEINMPLWIRIKRIVFGKINKLPANLNTTLVLFTIHLYLTMPFFFISEITPILKSLLRPFRLIHALGFDFEELAEKHRQLI